MTSLVYCAIYAQLLVLRALGGASYRTGIILVVGRMAAPPANTSSALAHLVHRQWFIMHPWTRVEEGDGGGDASRRYLYTPVSITQADNECRLEGDKTHEIFHFLSKKVGGGHFLCGPHQAEKWGGGRVPPVPHRSTPVVVIDKHNKVQLTDYVTTCHQTFWSISATINLSSQVLNPFHMLLSWG